SGQGENCQFGASVAAIEVLGGIRFSVATGLRLFEGLAERNPGSFDSAENVVASTIQDAGNAVQPVSAQPGPQRWQDRHSSCHGRAKLKLASGAIGQLQQVGTVTRDQLLI